MNFNTKKSISFRSQVIVLALLGAFELALPPSEANATGALLSITPASFNDTASSKIIFSPGGFNIDPDTKAITHLCSLRNGTWSTATPDGFKDCANPATGEKVAPEMKAIGMGPDISDYEKTYIKTFSLGVDPTGYLKARQALNDTHLPDTDVYKMIAKAYVYHTSVIDPKINAPVISWELNSAFLPSELKMPVAAGGTHTDVGFDHHKNTAPLLFSAPLNPGTEKLKIESEMAIPDLTVDNSGFTQSNLWIDLVQKRADGIFFPLGIQIRLMDSRGGSPDTRSRVSAAYFSTSLDDPSGITVLPDNTFHLTNQKQTNYKKISFEITKQNILDVINQVNAKITQDKLKFSTDLSFVKFQGAKIGNESGALLANNNPYNPAWLVKLQINIKYLNVSQY